MGAPPDTGSDSYEHRPNHKKTPPDERVSLMGGAYVDIKGMQRSKDYCSCCSPRKQ